MAAGQGARQPGRLAKGWAKGPQSAARACPGCPLPVAMQKEASWKQGKDETAKTAPPRKVHVHERDGSDTRSCDGWGPSWVSRCTPRSVFAAMSSLSAPRCRRRVDKRETLEWALCTTSSVWELPMSFSTGGVATKPLTFMLCAAYKGQCCLRILTIPKRNFFDLHE